MPLAPPRSPARAGFARLANPRASCSTPRPFQKDSRMRRLRSLDKVPLYVAVHEAGHAVASLALFSDYGAFERVVVRSPREVLAGPFIDGRGRARDLAGIVEGPEH